MESCCFRSGVKASAVTPQTKVEPGFIFHQFFRVLAGSCVFVFKAWRVCEKQPKAKTSGCLLPSLLKRSRHSASDQLCLSGLHSLTHRDSDLQEEVPSSKACFPKHGTGFPETLQWDDNNFPSLSRVHSPSRCPIMSQDKLRLQVNHRSHLNQPPTWLSFKTRCRWRSDQWPKTNCSISCWEVIPSSVC